MADDDNARVQADQAAAAAHVDNVNGVPSEAAPADGVSGPTVDGTIEDQTGVAGDAAREDNPVTSAADTTEEASEATPEAESASTEGDSDSAAEESSESTEATPDAPAESEAAPAEEASAESTNIPVTDADAEAETPSEPASDAGESAESEQPAAETETPAGK